MHYDISYRGDNSDHRALLDLVQWYGWKKARVLFGLMRDAKTLKAINRIVFAIEISGVAGHPVRRLIARFHGEERLQEWIDS